jgi:hypothetical protein
MSTNGEHPLELAEVIIKPDNVIGGSGSRPICTIVLTGVAPAGGIQVLLESQQPAIVRVPNSVIVPEGRDREDFYVDVFAVESETQVSVSASHDLAGRAVTLQVEPGPAAVAVLPAAAEPLPAPVPMPAAAIAEPEPPPPPDDLSFREGVALLAALIERSTLASRSQPAESEVARRKLQGPSDADRAQRTYRYSRLPVLETESLHLEPADRLAVLLETYREVNTNWRALTDVRFKLLALVPAVSVFVLIALLKSDTSAAAAPNPIVWLLSVVGLVVTVGLFVYDRRNSDLYDDLISRGRRIEAELGMDTGQFLGRRAARRKWLAHDAATTLVYSASIIAWIGALIWLVVQVVR